MTIKSVIIKLIIVFAVLFAIGGWVAVGQGLEIFGEIFKGFFPVFFEVAKNSVEDYLNSPYFIVGAVVSIASAFGIWIGATGEYAIFLVVSIICEVVSLASILSNLL